MVQPVPLMLKSSTFISMAATKRKMYIFPACAHAGSLKRSRPSSLSCVPAWRQASMTYPACTSLGSTTTNVEATMQPIVTARHEPLTSRHKPHASTKHVNVQARPSRKLTVMANGGLVGAVGQEELPVGAAGVEGLQGDACAQAQQPCRSRCPRCPRCLRLLRLTPQSLSHPTYAADVRQGTCLCRQPAATHHADGMRAQHCHAEGGAVQG